LRALREEGGSEEEVEKATGRVREVYERAIANFPPGDEKRHWRRYIFLWLYYAVFEESEAQVCATIGDFGSGVDTDYLAGLWTCTRHLQIGDLECPSQEVHIR
jgi:hypothetical protein